MNAKSLALAIALVASTGFVSSVQASDIVTLETVQVRPSADQLVQAQHQAAQGLQVAAPDAAAIAQAQQFSSSIGTQK